MIMQKFYQWYGKPVESVIQKLFKNVVNIDHSGKVDIHFQAKGTTWH
jgi:hypothetical protein